jgi:hypothetical protein
MTTNYSKILGVFAVVLLVASFVVPVKMANSSPVEAYDPAMDATAMQWLPVDTPDSMAILTKELFTPRIAGSTQEGGSEIIKLLVGNNGTLMYALVRHASDGQARVRYISLFQTWDGGVSWSDLIHTNLDRDAYNSTMVTCVWDIAIAPNDPTMVVAAISDATDATLTAAEAATALGFGIGQEVWISTDAGANWDNSQWPPTGVTVGTDLISCLDVSPEYGGSGAHDVLVGTRDGLGVNSYHLQTMQVPGYGGWNVQDVGLGNPVSVNPFFGDVIAAKFSPTYDADSTIALGYSKAYVAGQKSLLLLTGVHDLSNNQTTWQPFGDQVEIMNSGSPTDNSPAVDEIITADLELPSDFSGQSASLRRFYVSTDAIDSLTGTTVRATAVGVPNRGIYRIDDNIVYTLMDTSTTFKTAAQNQANRRISSIAYWGTYASGKLLAGEVLGDTCQAAVPTWFTDSPTVCPIPCWYPAKKPTSGAAGYAVCNSNSQSWGNAQVAWSPTYADQGVAYAATGSSNMDNVFNYPVAGDFVQAPFSATAGWPSGYLNIVPLDESAFALTRNNGETWNQLSLIDTRMSKLTDVAPSADCTTVYLASANNATNCRGFDSVWRSSMNEKVVAPPLPALEIGQIWERIRVSPTAVSCNQAESQYAILRLAPDKEDGQIVFWAAGGTGGRVNIPEAGRNQVDYPVGAPTRAVAWSPDYGDYWAAINPRITVQDMEAESSTILYIVNFASDVQKMPYLTTAWSSSYATVDAGPFAHTIDVYPEDKVGIGTARIAFMAFVSTNGGQAFRPAVRGAMEGPPTYGYHILFDTDYEENGMVYVASDRLNTGRIYRNKLPELGGSPWEDMVTPNTAHREYYGITQTNSDNVNNQGTLYVAHDSAVQTFGILDPNSPNTNNDPLALGGNADGLVDPGDTYGGVERTLHPLWGIPKPGVFWDCLDAAVTLYRVVPTVVEFTLEPKSLKHCGCLTPDTYTNLYAIDNDWYANNHNVWTGRGGVANLGDRGMLWRYIDCMAKKGPVLTMDDGEIIGCDPATGRNQEVNFTWEQLCIAIVYQLQISKTEGFDQMVFDGIFRPVSVMSPALVYLSGGEGTMPMTFTDVALANAIVIGNVYSLECGHSYFWRVRVRNETTDDMVRSPWSEKRSFSIKAGFRVTTPYMGPQLLAPDNGCGCECEAPLCFSWSPFKETTAYRFQLSENPDMSSPLVNEVVQESTAYQYTGDPKCNTNYFWRVMAVEPVESEWSATFSFMTQAEPPAPPEEQPIPEEATPIWVWVIIAIGAILVIVTLVLIFKTRRV